MGRKSKICSVIQTAMLAPNKQPRHINKQLLELAKGYGGRCGHYWRQIVSISGGTLRGDGLMCSKMREKKFVPKNGTKNCQLPRTKTIILWWDTNKIGLRVLFSGLLTKMCVRSVKVGSNSSINIVDAGSRFQDVLEHAVKNNKRQQIGDELKKIGAQRAHECARSIFVPFFGTNFSRVFAKKGENKEIRPKKWDEIKTKDRE